MSEQQLKTIVVLFRILVGLALLAVAIYLVVAGRADIQVLISIVAALLGLDRLVAAGTVPVKNGNGNGKNNWNYPG